MRLGSSGPNTSTSTRCIHVLAGTLNRRYRPAWLPIFTVNVFCPSVLAVCWYAVRQLCPSSDSLSSKALSRSGQCGAVITTVATGIRDAVAALGPDERPRLAWTNQDQTVTYTRCPDPACTTTGEEPTGITGRARALATTADATLLVTETDAALHLHICPRDTCSN